MTAEQLKKIMPYATAKSIEAYLPWLNEMMPKYDIDTPLRCAHFLAQLAHESGCFRYVRELASGKAYEGRKDLGNVYPGDGVKYKGRGLIQLTGRTNYTLFAATLPEGKNVVEHPELLEEPELAVAVSCWFWQKNNLNVLADRDDVRAVTRRINGGYNGLADREAYLKRAKEVLL